MQVSGLRFSAQLLRSSFRLVNLKSFPHQTLFWQPRPPSPRQKLSHFAFFHGVIASEGNWNWSDIYPPHTKAQSQICCNWKTFGNISSIDFDILPFGTSLEFWLARKKSDLKKLDIYLFLPHFGFLFRGSIFNLQKYVSVESASGRTFKCHYLHLDWVSDWLIWKSTWFTIKWNRPELSCLPLQRSSGLDCLCLEI